MSNSSNDRAASACGEVARGVHGLSVFGAVMPDGGAEMRCKQFEKFGTSLVELVEASPAYLTCFTLPPIVAGGRLSGSQWTVDSDLIDALSILDLGARSKVQPGHKALAAQGTLY